MKLRATVVVDYEPNPEHYGTDDLKEMAEIDAANWREDPLAVVTSFDEDQFNVTVEVVA